MAARSQAGFLNIDCGLPANSTYKSEINLDYVADSKFIKNGIIKQLPNINLPKIYQTLRYFPDHKRNCYGLPVTQGTNYLVRASFMYGNYDGSNMSPSFKLYLGVDLWETVTLQNATHMYWTEIFGSAVTGNMSVCLVNTSTGVPFISGLELRPLTGADGYKVNATSSLVTFQRIDVGGTEPVSKMETEKDTLEALGLGGRRSHGDSIEKRGLRKNGGIPTAGRAIRRRWSSSYYSKSRLTEKSDVYSFGVVLFELITGQNAVLIQGSQRVHNLDFAMPKIMSGDVASIVDPRLQGQYDINSVWKVAETAIACTAEKGITRPTMTEIVRELGEAIDMETDHQLHSKRQSTELDSRLLSISPALLDMDSFSHPSAR
ncbi:hypothetical protein EJ110_NYTH29077 [Nymphaea thermarum]|nr:hypothetical protein EJ110_NYTH29077 [Nymphaea thermarum]